MTKKIAIIGKLYPLYLALESMDLLCAINFVILKAQI